MRWQFQKQVKNIINIALNIYEKLHTLKRGGGQYMLVYDELEQIISKKDSPYEHIELSLLKNCINDYIATLPKISRMAFVGRYWYFDSIQDISKHLGISVSKTKTLLFRTRNGLREHLKKEGFII